MRPALIWSNSKDLVPGPEAQKDIAGRKDDNLDALICAFVVYPFAFAGAGR